MATISSYCIAASALLLLAPSVALAQEGEATPPPATEATPPAAAPAAPAAAAEKPAEKPAEDPKDRPSPNSIFVELGGAAIFYSLNYERRVIDDLGVRLGVGYFGVGASASSGGTSASVGYSILSVPLTVQYLGVRSGKHGLEAGAGVNFAYETGVATASSGGTTASASGSAFTPMGLAHVGYRLHPVGKVGFHFRVGAMLAVARGWGFGRTLDNGIDDPLAVGFLPSGYLSLGASF
jgi:hypothetical protein